MQIFVRQEKDTGRQQLIFDITEKLVWFEQTTPEQRLLMIQMTARMIPNEPDLGILFQVFAEKNFPCGIITMSDQIWPEEDKY